MRKWIVNCVFPLIVVAVLPACSGGGEAERTSTVQAESVEEIVDAPVSAASSSNIEFSVSPAALSDCPDASPVSALVDWVVRDLTVTEVRVEVSDSEEGERKLLSIGGRQGQVSTDAWVKGGTAFFLTDSKTGRWMATFKVGHLACE